MWRIFLLDDCEIEALLVEYADQLLGHLDKREDDSLLFCKTALEVIVL